MSRWRSKLRPRRTEHRSTVRERVLAHDVDGPQPLDVSQAGLVNNLNDGMAWGLFPLVFAAAGWISSRSALWPPSTRRRGAWRSSSPARWSDRVGRKWLIVAGMWVQAIGIGVVTLSSGFSGFAIGAALLGIGTAMVYPTLLAAIGDVAHPSWRARRRRVSPLARPRLCDRRAARGHHGRPLGFQGAMWFVASITFGSGVVAAIRMEETAAVRKILRASNGTTASAQ